MSPASLIAGVRMQTEVQKYVILKAQHEIQQRQKRVRHEPVSQAPRKKANASKADLRVENETFILSEDACIRCTLKHDSPVLQIRLFKQVCSLRGMACAHHPAQG